MGRSDYDHALLVRSLDFVPEYGTGGEMVPLECAEPRGVAAKVLEEAAEAFASWRLYRMCGGTPVTFPDGRGGDPALAGDLADRLADTVMACCDLAALYGLDLEGAMGRRERRNRERGRYDG